MAYAENHLRQVASILRRASQLLVNFPPSSMERKAARAKLGVR